MKRFCLALSMFFISLAATVALPRDRLADYPPVEPGHALRFPADHGAHPDFRTEWWYVTGWLQTPAGSPLGFQVTFFRSRPRFAPGNPSRFAPKELLFAHVAISDPALGRLQHDQRVARAGFGLAQALAGNTDVHIGPWSLKRNPAGVYHAAIQARDFTFELTLRPTESLLLEGDDGYSRKGPLPLQASYYYSQPQLAVSGTLVRGGQRQTVQGTAWLDHEWSSAALAEQAVGWDWVGVNLADGGALMAFQIRDKTGRKFWAGGMLRRGDGSQAHLPSSAIAFTPLRHWRSPRTATDYPVSMRVEAGGHTLELMPLMDDQELDSRASTGAIYWEGAVTALEGGQSVGRGYLELTGYSQRLNF